MCVGKVQVEVDVKSQLMRLPVPRRVSIQRGGSSPFGLEKASCIVILIVILCKKTGSFSKQEKLKIIIDTRAHRSVCISKVSESFKQIESKNSIQKELKRVHKSENFKLKKDLRVPRT